MTRGNNRNVVFRQSDDYWYFLDLMRKYKKVHPFDLYHYCLMPNHAHMQIQTKSPLDFATFMKKLNLAYFHHYRQKYGWAGHFWQDRYKSQPIGKDSYFIQCGKYIELNPLRSGLIKNPEDYQFSSYNYYAFGKSNVLIAKDIFYDDLGKTAPEREKNYRELVINEFVEINYTQPIWGSNEQRYKEQQKINRKTK
ncbi:MAG: transposase [Patescibacteria group bacterium]|nr:transposase [Patescibacteria group bacterium]